MLSLATRTIAKKNYLTSNFLTLNHGLERVKDRLFLRPDPRTPPMAWLRLGKKPRFIIWRAIFFSFIIRLAGKLPGFCFRCAARNFSVRIYIFFPAFFPDSGSQGFVRTLPMFALYISFIPLRRFFGGA